VLRPRGLLLDYGGTLVEEVEFNVRAGVELLLARAAYRPAHATLEAVLERADRVSREVAARRSMFQIETPWPSLTRLIHDFFGTRFAEPLPALELAFWDASVTTRPMPGVRAAMLEFHRCGVPMGVVSNSSFGQNVIRHELAKHGLAEHIAIVIVSAEYAVRKPNLLLFETATAMLGVRAEDAWFVGDSFDADIVGAKAAGMTAVWYAPSSAEQPRGADLVVQTWDEVVGAFREARE
jgi:putative hydrolase of the HAD superfamily